MRSQSPVSCWVVLLFVAWVGSSHGQQKPWSPERNVEIVVGVTPGGSMDKIARTVQGIWQAKRVVEASTSVVNKPGGGGIIGLTYLNQHPADPHYLSVMSVGLVTNHITGRTPLNHTEITPIAMLATEYVGFAVRADSSLRTRDDVAQRMRENPGATSIGFASSHGNANHLAIVLAMKGMGIEAKQLRTPVFKSGGETTVALLGGHVEVAALGAGNFVPHMQTGKLRVLAISGARRVGGALAEIPTWRELGVDFVMGSWYVLIAPKGVNAQQTVYWEERVRLATQADEWAKDQREQYRDSIFMGALASRKYLASEFDQFKATLIEIGLAK